MEILEWQTTCLIGPLGAAQKSLEHTSGAHLKFKETTLEISGTAHQRQLAQLYIDLTLQLKTSNLSDSDVVDDARILHCTGLSTFEVDSHCVKTV